VDNVGAKYRDEIKQLRSVLETVAEDLHNWHRFECLRLGGPTIEEWQDCPLDGCVAARAALGVGED
jgi:hypothetical protein